MKIFANKALKEHKCDNVNDLSDDKRIFIVRSGQNKCYVYFTQLCC